MPVDRDRRKEKVEQLTAKVVTREILWNSGSTSLQQVQTVTAFNDIGENSGQLYIEMVFPAKDYTEMGYKNPWTESIKAEGKTFFERGFTNDEKESFLFGINILKLPGLVVIHELMNNGMTKEGMEIKYGRPPEDTKRPAIISLGKTSYEGKTMLATVMKMNGIEVVNLDHLSTDQEVLDGYEKIAQGRKDVKAIVESIQQGLKGEVEWTKETKDWTARNALDELCKVFAKTEDGEVVRPEMVVCDLSGYRTWNVGESGRMINIIDFIRDYSMTCIQLARFEFGREGNKITRSGQEVDYREIEDYWKIFSAPEIAEKLTLLHRTKDDALIEMIAGDQDKWLQKYRYWANQAVPGMQMSLADVDRQIEAEAKEEGRPYGQLQVWMETFSR